jgi:LCP family protein required for cell wall assembly
VAAIPPPGGTAGPSSKVRRRRFPWRWIPRLIVAILLLAAVGIPAGAVWVDRSLHRIAAFADYPERPAAGRGTSWLLVGSDSRTDLTPEQQAELSTGGDLGNGRTDTILLVHVPALGSSTPATVVSIPRDSYVPIPGYGKDKINSALSLGGAPLLTQTVEQATGIRLDHYAEIGFGGFAGVVDAMGGVSMCLPEPVSDPLAGIDLAAGCQELDGRNALGYVRSRATPRADLDRMIHQRAFLGALLHRAASPSVWANPWRWASVPRGVVGALTVDQGDHVWDLARLGWALAGSSTMITVPVGKFTTNDSGDVVIWDHAAADALFDALAQDQRVPQAAWDAQP